MTEIADRYFSGGRLLLLPRKPGRQRAVLSRLAQDFFYDHLYAEREVNEILLTHFDDHCTLRRALVDFGLLARAGGRYWRVHDAT